MTHGEFTLDEAEWAAMPERHRAFLRGALRFCRGDDRLVGVLAGGSFISGRLDEFSDLDLIIVDESGAIASARDERIQIAESLGDLLAAFTGEHVGEPRLIICLYGPQPLLHVDLKFIGVDDLATRVEDPVILWALDERIGAALSRGEAAYPQPGLQWFEDRMWVWTHYIAAKIARGELFEAIDALAYIRTRVLGPLIQLQEKHDQPNGLRRIEDIAPRRVQALRATLASHDAASCRDGLHATIDLYADLRDELAGGALVRRDRAESEARVYLAETLGSL